MQIEIVKGGEADALLRDRGFESSWSELYRRCAWATPLQTPQFAIAWYGIYRSRFEPLLVFSRGAGGELQGLLALGVSRKGSFVGAGGHQAEYQCWLATDECGDTFPSHALPELLRCFRGTALMLEYLPPATPLGWLRNDASLAHRMLLTPHDRPLLRFGDGTFIEQMLKRKNIRTRLTKLQKLGYCGIERICDVATLEQIFDEIIVYHDLRRIVVSGSGPFENDPRKKQFHLELMRRGLLEVTVLKSGQRIVSAQLDFLGRNSEVHLAMGAYAPWAARYAPGKIHILQLASMLMKEGYERLDLTPGPDGYKEEFATEWDKVHTLRALPGAWSRRKAVVVAGLEQTGRRVLRRYGIEPVRAKLQIRELRHYPVASTLRVLRKANAWFRSHRESAIYYSSPPALNPLQAEPPKGVELRMDALDDLLRYRQTMSGDARHIYLAAASQRLADEMHVYTSVNDGRLAFAAWSTDQPAKVLGEDLVEALALPDGCVLIFDVFACDGATDVTARWLQQTLSLSAGGAARASLLVVSSAQRGLRYIAERSGFTCCATIRSDLLCGRLRRRTVVHQPAVEKAGPALAAAQAAPHRPQQRPHRQAMRSGVISNG